MDTSDTIAIVADGLARSLPTTTFDELVTRLERTGLARRDLETGEIVERSASAELAHRLREQVSGGSRVLTLLAGDPAVLYPVLDQWLGEVGEPGFRRRRWSSATRCTTT